MQIGLIKLISTQKVLKIYINKGVKYHFLRSNHIQGGLSLNMEKQSFVDVEGAFSLQSREPPKGAYQ